MIVELEPMDIVTDKMPKFSEVPQKVLEWINDVGGKSRNLLLRNQEGE